MKLELYYVVQKYWPDGSEIDKPRYEAGPFHSWDEADMHRASIWLNNTWYVIVEQVLDVEEV